MPRLSTRIAQDALFYFKLHRPDQLPGLLRVWGVALRSRGFWLLVLQRISHFATTQRNLRSPWWWLARLFETTILFQMAIIAKSEVRGDCQFEGDVYLSDKGYLVFGAQSVGSGSLIHDHVTSGYGVADGNKARPVIGSNVWIGPGCIVVGGLTVGEGATLLPGSFVTTNVLARAVVGGNPARVIRRDFDNSSLRKSLEIVREIPKETST